MSRVDEALALAAKGHRIFPANGKKPQPGIKWPDVATTDEATIREWWAEWPEATVGLCLAEGTMVVDVDDLEATVAAEADGLEFVDTPRQTTPSGGLHLFHRTDGRPVAQVVRRGGIDLDTRVGGKGYVIAWQPETIPPIDEWAMAPEWVYERLERPQAVVGDPDAPMDTDNAIVQWLGKLVSESTHQYTESELVAFQVAALGDGRIIAAATPWTQADWKRHARQAVKWEPGTGIDRGLPGLMKSKVTSAGEWPAPNDAEAPDSTGSPDNVINIAIRPSKPAIFGVFGSPEGITLGPFGDSGVGKTIIILGMFLMAATGKAVIPGLTPPKTPLRVLYLDYERRQNMNRRRLDQIARGAGIELPVDGMFMFEPVHNLDTTEGKAEFVNKVNEHRPDLVFIDSGSYVSNLDPKDKEAPDVLAAAFRAIGLPIIAPLHVPKDAGDPTKPYGSNYWPAIALETDSAISIGGVVEDEAADGSPVFRVSPHTVLVRNRKNSDDDPYLPWAVTIEWPSKGEDGIYAPDAEIVFRKADAGETQRTYRELRAKADGRKGGRPAVDYSHLAEAIETAMPVRGALYSKQEVRRAVEAATGETLSDDVWGRVWRWFAEDGSLQVDRMGVRRPLAPTTA